ncbi:MAG: YgaP-like transmembrane domain [Candidatus Bipolaricaulia bacterium]
MKNNVGKWDSRVRSRLGMILILVGILQFVGLVKFGLVTGVVLLLVGVVLVGTGTTRKCGIYSLIGVDTSREEEPGS